jgi:hypothetical protein
MECGGCKALIGYRCCAGKIDTAVVAAPLDENEIAGLNDLEREIPMAFRNIAVE